MIKEITRRCATTGTEGIACGPVGNNCAVAEMEIEKDGEKRFLTVSWIDEVRDEVAFEVTKESIYDLMLFVEDDLEKLERIRSEAPGEKENDYKDQYKELVKLLKATLVKDNIFNPYEELEDYYDEEELEELNQMDEEERAVKIWGF